MIIRLVLRETSLKPIMIFVDDFNIKPKISVKQLKLITCLVDMEVKINPNKSSYVIMNV